MQGPLAPWLNVMNKWTPALDLSQNSHRLSLSLMWWTQEGARVLKGAEGALFRETLAWLWKLSRP